MITDSQSPLQRMLAQRDWLLADGATGTNLFNMGLSSGDAAELWNLTAPEKIKALYKGSVDAGSDLFLTNSFGGNRSRLKLHGAEKIDLIFPAIDSIKEPKLSALLPDIATVSNPLDYTTPIWGQAEMTYPVFAKAISAIEADWKLSQCPAIELTNHFPG